MRVLLDAQCCRIGRVVCRPRQIRHLLLVPKFRRHLTCSSFYSSSFPFFHSLCLGDSVLVRIHPCFSCQGPLDNRSGSLSAFVIIWLCRFSIQCMRCTAWAASSVTASLDVCRQHAESSWLSLWNSVNYNPWQWGSSSFSVRCNFLCQFQFRSHHLPRSVTQAAPVRRFPRITQCLLAQILSWECTKTAPVRS